MSSARQSSLFLQIMLSGDIMNAVVNNVTKKFGELKEEVGHKVWLAGLGAYSKGVEEFNGLSGKSRSLMDELVERGLEVERVAKERISSTASQTSSNIEKRLRALEERVHAIVAKLTGLDSRSLINFDEKLQKLNQRVEALTGKQKEEKPAASKAVATKTKAAKPAARKAVANKAKAEPKAEKPAQKEEAAVVVEAKAAPAVEKPKAEKVEKPVQKEEAVVATKAKAAPAEEKPATESAE
jgi:uncharacterized coiled-coil protein SlyX